MLADPGRDDEQYFLLTNVRGDSHGGRLAGRRVLHGDLLDLGRRDVLTAATNRVFDAAKEPEIVVRIPYRKVTGVVPEVAEGFQRGFRSAEIASEHDVRQFRARYELTGGAVWHRTSVCVDDCHLVVGVQLAEQARPVRVIAADEDDLTLGLAIRRVV